MALRLLHTSASLQLFHDTDHDWLYLDWQGPITPLTLQDGWLQLTRCLLERPYARVLNSNVQVTHVEHGASRWLLRGFERFLHLSGIRQFAWVYAPCIPGFSLAEGVAAALPKFNMALFADEEEAVTWLRHYCEGSYPRSHSAESLTQLRNLVRALEQRAVQILGMAGRA